LQAFKSVHQYREQAPIGFWLRQIAINKVWMHHRQRQRYVEDPCFEHVEAPQVDHLADQQLEDLLKYLSPVARTVVWLYHVEGYSHEEIADMQGKSLSFSKSQLSRAHQKLRHLLEEGS
jgi:RNA polymerase sigma-70 factor (ECF subfamily)